MSMEEQEDDISTEELFKEVRALAKTLVTQYNECVEGTHKLIKKVKHAEASSEELLLVPKAPLKRWLTAKSLSDKEVFTVEEFLKLYFSHAAKEGRLEYSTLRIELTRDEMTLFQFKEPSVSYFQFMSHLPSVFC